VAVVAILLDGDQKLRQVAATGGFEIHESSSAGGNIDKQVGLCGRAVSTLAAAQARLVRAHARGAAGARG
jgi:hypothetical protein